ncbi:MAG: winged helix-turn-helix domain-containing protein [Chloroflexi bacterium]|nr:winged helix-turn-helix domain-containing protein [Chloroflexota bacterium]
MANPKWYVHRLRQKLGDNPASPKFIKTEAGVGYQFIKDQ